MTVIHNDAVAAPETRADTGPSAAEPLTKVFTPGILRVLALVTLGMALALFIAGMSHPERFEVDIARYVLCLAVATTLSIFFFVFYPQSIEFNLPSAIGASLRVIGPVALWFGVFLFLWNQMPSPPRGRVFFPTKNGQPGGMRYSTETEIYTEDGKKIANWPIKNKDDNRLYGIYIEFEKNVRAYKAKLEHPPFAPIDVTFSRDGSDTFDVSKFKLKENN